MCSSVVDKLYNLSYPDGFNHNRNAPKNTLEENLRLMKELRSTTIHKLSSLDSMRPDSQYL